MAIEMGKITIVLSDDIEERLRTKTRKRGDLSRIIEKALEEWLERNKEGKKDG